MGKRRRSFAERELRRELSRFLSLNRRLLLQSTGVAAVTCVVPVAMGSPGYTTGFVHAFVGTALLAIFAFAFLFAGGGALVVAGTYGEAYTQKEIEKALKLGRVWGAVHNIELGSLDIDHLVLSPGGVLVLETKWRFKGADRRWLAAAVGQAESSARKARSVLRSEDVGHVSEVRPVLVVWGGGRRELAASQVVSGVDVVRGDALLPWLEQCGRGRLAEDHAEELLRRLTAFARAHHDVADRVATEAR